MKKRIYDCLYPGGIGDNSRWWSASGTTGKMRYMRCTPAGVREEHSKINDHFNVLVEGILPRVLSVTPAGVKIPGGVVPVVPLSASPTGYYPESLRDKSIGCRWRGRHD